MMMSEYIRKREVEAAALCCARGSFLHVHASRRRVVVSRGVYVVERRHGGNAALCCSRRPLQPAAKNVPRWAMHSRGREEISTFLAVLRTAKKTN